MKDRFYIYAAIIFVYYIGAYIWMQNQKMEEREKEIIILEEMVKDQNKLISVQNEYIKLLEVEYQSPLNNSPRKFYDPI